MTVDPGLVFQGLSFTGVVVLAFFNLRMRGQSDQFRLEQAKERERFKEEIDKERGAQQEQRQRIIDRLDGIRADAGKVRDDLSREISSTADNFRRELQRAQEELRREFGQSFVPGAVAMEQRESQLYRLTSIESELKGVRDRLHQVATTMTTIGLACGELASIKDRIDDLNERMTEKARRITSLETQRQADVQILHEHTNRIHDLERKL
jgi:hypothetical protein